MFSPAAAQLQRKSTATFIRIARHQACRHRALSRLTVRCLATAADPKANTKRRGSLALDSESRYNEIGVQQLSSHVYNQIFPDGAKTPPAALVELSKDHLRRHDLLGKNTDNSDPIAFDLPPLHGRTLD